MAMGGKDHQETAKVGNITMESSGHSAGRYIVIQWNDYRKENFLVFLGGFSNIQKAREVQLRCLEGFQKEGWISRLPYTHSILTCDPDHSIRMGNSSTNLFERKFIGVGMEDEPEMFTVDIFFAKHAKRIVGKGIGDLQQVNVETYWGGWCGLNTCFVEDQISSDACTEIEIDLSDFDSMDKASNDHPKNHRYDYEKRRVHRYIVTYVTDHEYPMLTW